MESREEQSNVTFTKQQILAAGSYCDRRDLLNVLLEDEQPYTLAEVDQAIAEFMNRGVK